jgi:hypothetical protein
VDPFEVDTAFTVECLHCRNRQAAEKAGSASRLVKLHFNVCWSNEQRLDDHLAFWKVAQDRGKFCRKAFEHGYQALPVESGCPLWVGTASS